MELRQRRHSDTHSVDIELLELAADLNASPRSYVEIMTPSRPEDMHDGEEHLLAKSKQGEFKSEEDETDSLAPPHVPLTPGENRVELKISSPEIVLEGNRFATNTMKQHMPGLRHSMIYVPTHRDAIRNLMIGWFGVSLELVNTALSVLCCIFYLIELYDPSGYSFLQIKVMDIAATFYFTLHYVLHLYTEDDVRAFVFSFNGIIDMTLVPSIILYFLHDPSTRQLTLFRVFRVFRALRVLRLHNLIRSRKNGYTYEWGVFIFSLSAIIFVAAGIFHALEDYPDRSRPLQFHDSLYYILVTLSTIGYGDIVPSHTLSEFFVMGLIICVLTTVPAQISRLHALHIATHPYDGKYLVRPGRGHVIVCGHLVHDSFADFLIEFYHPTRGVINFDVVILSEDPPSEAMTRLLSNVNYAAKTKFLKGSLVHEIDRKRVKLEAAEAVFVLADKTTRQAEIQDAATLLQALSIRNFADSTGCRPRVYLQMISENHNELSHIVGANQTINSIRIKGDIVSRGVLCPGSCALILNLMQSVDRNKIKRHVSNPSPWLQEYIHGMSQQVYAVLFSEDFEGHRYEDIARRFFQGFEVTLLAVYRRENDDDLPHVMLSPFGKLIREGDIGFILSSSAAVVHDILTEYATLARTEVQFPMSPRNSTRALPYVSKSNLLHRSSPASRKIKLPNVVEAPTSPTAHEGVDRILLTDLRLRQATKKDLSTLSKHIVVCGSNRHVLHLIDQLRSMCGKIVDTPPTIVCLVDQLPQASDFDLEYSLPENVYFVRGIATKCADLLRVAAPTARAVLMFPHDTSYQDLDTDAATYLLDYGVVTSLLCLETACDSSQSNSDPRSSVAARDELEICARHGISLSAVQSRMRAHFPTINPELFRAPSLERLHDQLSSCCESFVNNCLCDLPSVAVLQRGSNIKFCRPRDVNFSSDSWPYLSPAYAAGRVFVDSRLDLVLCQAFYNPYITEILLGLTGSPIEDSTTPQESTLYQESIPQEFVNGLFGDVFKEMLRHGKLVIGLYRYPHMKLGNALPYVLTSPPSHCQVYSQDKLFVVGPLRQSVSKGYI